MWNQHQRIELNWIILKLAPENRIKLNWIVWYSELLDVIGSIGILKRKKVLRVEGKNYSNKVWLTFMVLTKSLKTLILILILIFIWISILILIFIFIFISMSILILILILILIVCLKIRDFDPVAYL